MFNLMRLTKLEGKVLVALLEQTVFHRKCRRHKEGRNDYWDKALPDIDWKDDMPDGSHTERIAEAVYRDTRSMMYGGRLVPSVKSSMSRVLAILYRKGLVKRAKPIYQKAHWQKEENEYGYWTRRLSYLSARWISDEGEITEGSIHLLPSTSLPRGVHVWWLLTDKGWDLAEELNGRKKKRERCSTCWRWNSLECMTVERLRGIADRWDEIENCKWYHEPDASAIFA